MRKKISISVQPTPNPNSVKFSVDQILLPEGTVDIPSRASAGRSPLASLLFEDARVAGVFIGMNFVTVTKTDQTPWSALEGTVAETIQTFLGTGKEVIATQETVAPPLSDISGGEIGKKIRDILDREIRPAVAMDGGDITFVGYERGIVTLHLQGACSACPASLMTLKMGVENRLKELIPEVQEVVQVGGPNPFHP